MSASEPPKPPSIDDLLRSRASAMPAGLADEVARAAQERIHESYRRSIEPVARQASEDMLLISRAVRGGEDLTPADRDEAERREQAVLAGLLGDLARLPVLDDAGQPLVDQRTGYLDRRGIKVTEHVRYLAIRDGPRILRERFRATDDRFWNTEDRAAFVAELDGWDDGTTTDALALRVVAAAAADAVIAPVGVLFQVVRLRAEDPRGREVARAQRRGERQRGGGDVLTLETLVAARDLVIRVLDEPLRYDDEAPTPVTADEQLAVAMHKLREALVLVTAVLPDIPRLAVVAQKLPLGESLAVGRAVPPFSTIEEPEADARRASDKRAPIELHAGLGPLGDWTLVTRADDIVGVVQREHEHELARRGRSSVSRVENIGSAVRWHASGARGDLDDALHRGIELARVGVHRYPPRSAGHPVMFSGTTDRRKARASMHGLLAYAAAERIESFLLGGP